MHYRVFCTVKRFKGLCDNMFPCLGKDLNGHVVGNEIALNQGTTELVFRFTCRRKPDFDFLKPDLAKQSEKLKFFFQTHWHDERLIAVAQIHATPNRRRVYRVFFYPIHAHARRREILFFIFITVFHNIPF
jgi:hypothetical protein